jgi:glycosyltransferase involved in cell wall biosynthesis
MQQGVPERKIVVVPLAYETSGVQEIRDQGLEVRGSGEPLRILFLGQVNLRKGIQYLIQAAKMLPDEPVQFDVVGPLGISEEALKSAPSNMIFHGAINRDRAPEFFGKADLFVLPTLSDGFALTQLEAMAYGLPVIATPNCGAVVTDGVDGMIVAARSSEEIYQAIKTFLSESEKLHSMRAASRRKAAEYGMKYLEQHLNVMEEMLEKKGEQ